MNPFRREKPSYCPPFHPSHLVTILPEAYSTRSTPRPMDALALKLYPVMKYLLSPKSLSGSKDRT